MTAVPEETARPLRVATVPYAGAYAAAVLPAGVVRVGPDLSPSPWLDPEHLTAHAAELDVLHLHGGYEHLTAPELDAWTAAVRRCGVPLVVTVHDLTPREAPDGTLRRTRHRAHLRALLATAEVVLTLTRGAADEIADRFGRTAIVVAHPSLAEPTPDVGRETRLVGLHLGRLGPEVAEPETLVRAALSGAVSGGGRLRVDVHPDVDLAARLPELLELAGAGQLELARSWPQGPAAWVRHLQGLHVSVLPRRTSTHSGWVELCRDAGTRLLVPRGGRHSEQWADVVLYGNDPEQGLDAASLTSAVVAALTRPAPDRVDRAWRAAQRAAVQRVHAQVYEQVAADAAVV
ncbi:MULTISPECIES: glycosyltransferase [unclassified Modestobacter]|uniref:glycosyltransferase n=1 Tax=unclassified Modestobacter TaxID=2643866 RepID=UPI0022AB2EA4|nr:MULTISPECIES: glycosyltransferase [unclassified Modestobacter]MCZ2823450.1 glycosyltransferase [Modestobacter sp. VKM Ac-2981]MCZ2851695.1 glycosyltransferase [Modestobacter sp. VKM Ac-2982]